MKPAAIYARVSTEDQAKNTSLPSQIEACRAFASQHGYSVLKVITEDVSGARLDRPGLDELRDMAASGEVAAVIVFDPDRLSRSLAHTMLLSEEFERRQVALLFVNAPREDTPEGRMLFGMRALFAEYERTKIMERTRRGKEQKLKSGHIFGVRFIPYGYRFVRVGDRGQYEVYEAEAAVVRQIFEWVVRDRMSLHAIAFKLRELGVPTQKRASMWHPSTLYNIVTNQAYVGTTYWNKTKAVEPARSARGNAKRPKTSSVRRDRSEWIAIPCPPVVSQELFDAARQQLALNKRHAPRNAKHFYLLRGLVICDLCGYRMAGAHSSRKGDRKVYVCPSTYRIVATARGGKCAQRRIAGDWLEQQVWKRVVAQLSDRKKIRAHLQNRHGEADRQIHSLRDQLESLAAAAANLDREEDNLLELYAEEALDKERIKARLQLIKRQRDALSHTKTELLARIEQYDYARADDEQLEECCQMIAEEWPHLTEQDRRAVLEMMHTTIRIDATHAHVSGYFDSVSFSLSGMSKRSAEEPGGVEKEIVSTGSRYSGYNLKIPFAVSIPLAGSRTK